MPRPSRPSSSTASATSASRSASSASSRCSAPSASTPCSPPRPGSPASRWSSSATSGDALTVLCLLLFMGAMGKSAQFLLHTWLPDAMEGPTPVSALIHAATMVTAGVFMVARLSPLFERRRRRSSVVTLVGAVTAFFAATVGLVQNDIKRVIAYSTCSQLGYMFVGLRRRAPTRPASSTSSPTPSSRRCCSSARARSSTPCTTSRTCARWAGLRRRSRSPTAMMLIGTLALTGVGIPHLIGFAGFHSKDAIIEAAFAAHTPMTTTPSGCCVIAAFMTSFYSWRLDVHDASMGTHARRPRTAIRATPTRARCVMLIPLAGAGASALWSLASASPSQHYFIGEGYKEFWGKALFEGAHNHILHAMHEMPALVRLSPDRCHARRASRSPTLLHRAHRRCRRRPRGRSGRSICSCSTSGTSTSCMTGSSCARPSGSAACSGSAATARSSTAWGPTASRPGARTHGPRRQAADRLRLSLRLRHADRRGADRHLASCSRGAGDDDAPASGFSPLITFFPLVGAVAHLCCLQQGGDRATRAGSRCYTTLFTLRCCRSTCGPTSIRRSRLPVRRGDGLARRLHPLQDGRRRHLDAVRGADRVPDAALHPRQLAIDRAPREGVHDRLPACSRR